MSERERWIIYPLLFFALGAALRDKFTQHVKTDNLFAAKITCEELSVIDSEKPARIVAQLTSGAPQQQGDQPSDRFGVLILRDSENNDLCGVTNNQLVVNQIACQAVSVVDPQNPNRRLALLTSTTTTDENKKTRRTGSLLLSNSEGQELFGLVDERLKMRHVICEGIAVIDADDPNRTLAALGSAKAETPDGKLSRLGVLVLNDQTLVGVRGTPREPPADDEQEPAEPPADGPTAGAPPDSESL